MSRRHRRKSHPKPAPVETCPAISTAEALTGSPVNGFYDANLTARERIDMEITLESQETPTLEEEIRITRTMLRRVLEYSESMDTLERVISVLNAVGTGAIRVAKLLKENRNFEDNSAEFRQALDVAVREMRADQGLDG